LAAMNDHARRTSRPLTFRATRGCLRPAGGSALTGKGARVH
jgi:hypothetical protein